MTSLLQITFNLLFLIIAIIAQPKDNVPKKKERLPMFYREHLVATETVQLQQRQSPNTPTIEPTLEPSRESLEQPVSIIATNSPTAGDTITGTQYESEAGSDTVSSVPSSLPSAAIHSSKLKGSKLKGSQSKNAVPSKGLKSPAKTSPSKLKGEISTCAPSLSLHTLSPSLSIPTIPEDSISPLPMDTSTESPSVATPTIEPTAGDSTLEEKCQDSEEALRDCLSNLEAPDSCTSCIDAAMPTLSSQCWIYQTHLCPALATCDCSGCTSHFETLLSCTISNVPDCGLNCAQCDPQEVTTCFGDQDSTACFDCLRDATSQFVFSCTQITTAICPAIQTCCSPCQDPVQSYMACLHNKPPAPCALVCT